MALTETRPETNEAPVIETRSPSSVEGLLGSGDHKTIGRLFIGGGALGLAGALVVGIVAVFYANNLDDLASGDTDLLPQIWSLSRDLALFGGLVPLLVGLAVYIVPLQIGAPSLAFPRGASAAFWSWALGSGLLILAYVFNGGPGGGRRDFVVLWAASLAMMVGALLWALVCLAATILGARTVGMSLDRAPQTTWSFLVFALVGLFSLPVLMAELLMAFVRIRYFHLPISESAQLTSVADGVNLAPSIYWLGIPVLGISADIIAAHTGQPLRMHRAIMVAIGLFGLLSFGADVVGLASLRAVDFNNGFLVVGLAAAILPVLGTLALSGDSIRTGSLVPRVPLVGALLSGLLLLLATATSLLGLIEPVAGWIDDVFDQNLLENTLVLNGTRFHEAIRALVIGAALVGSIAALHHWSAKIWGRRMAEPVGFLALLAAAGGSVILAIGELAAGIDDQPWLPARAGDDYSSGLATISLIGAVVLAAGAVILLGNVLMTVVSTSGKPAGSSAPPWSGATLEWATASPPPVGNFPAPPIVTSASPLADGELQYAVIGDTDSPDDAGDGASAKEDESQ